jgi:hypothetical protein
MRHIQPMLQERRPPASDSGFNRSIAQRVVVVATASVNAERERRL